MHSIYIFLLELCNLCSSHLLLLWHEVKVSFGFFRFHFEEMKDRQKSQIAWILILQSLEDRNMERLLHLVHHCGRNNQFNLPCPGQIGLPLVKCVRLAYWRGKVKLVMAALAFTLLHQDNHHLPNNVTFSVLTLCEENSKTDLFTIL